MTELNKTALVMGAGSGIGRAVALRLAADGYHIAAADIDHDAVRSTAELVMATGRATCAYGIDASNGTKVAELAALIDQELGPVEVAVNSAGILRMGLVADIPLKDWSDSFRVNVDGVFHVCRAVLPAMLARRRGRIVNVASWFGKVGKPHFAAYCASKFAVIGLTQSLAMEVAADGITVNAVCPGTIIATRMREVADDGARRLKMPTALERQGSIPMGRVGKPDDVADVISFLVSDNARYMTGQAVNVTGGLWMS